MVMNAIVLPVFFLSSALFPTEALSGVLKTAVSLNPFTHVINALRSVILSGKMEMRSLVFVSVLFLILGAAGFGCALHNLKKEMLL